MERSELYRRRIVHRAFDALNDDLEKESSVRQHFRKRMDKLCITAKDDAKVGRVVGNEWQWCPWALDKYDERDLRVAKMEAESQ